MNVLVLESIRSLLSEPDVERPSTIYNSVAALSYSSNRSQLDDTARRWTMMYAVR